MAFWNEDLNSQSNVTTAYVRRVFANAPVIHGKNWQDDVTVVNIEVIKEGTMAVDLSDGTTIRVDFERYNRNV